MSDFWKLEVERVSRETSPPTRSLKQKQLKYLTILSDIVRRFVSLLRLFFGFSNSETVQTYTLVHFGFRALWYGKHYSA